MHIIWKKNIGNWFCATICEKEIYCFKCCDCLNWKSIFLILKNPALIGLIKFVDIQKIMILSMIGIKLRI